MSAELLRAAVGYAAEHGADVVEGYPVEPDGHRAADLYHGTVRMFTDAGFELVERCGPARALVRRRIGRGR